MRQGRATDTFLDFDVGDYVVHADHGIARFNGLKTIEAAGAPHDCLELLYAGGDRSADRVVAPHVVAREPRVDPNSGFYHLRARWMDPAVGRFISSDPLAPDVFEPASLHKYLYANLDPVNKVDPLGLSPSISSLIGAAIQAILAAIRVGVIRIFWAVQLRLGQAIFWYLQNAIKVELIALLGPLVIGGALAFTDYALTTLIENTDPVPDDVGGFVEEARRLVSERLTRGRPPFST
mgnify:CR=1 FL=1